MSEREPVADSAAAQDAEALRDVAVRRVVVIEGSVNALVLAVKLFVGISTGSLAVLADALHSLTDVANNIVAWFILRVSTAPPDHDHPYGHRKFETLAVFGLATLMTVLGVELALGAIRREPRPIGEDGWTLALMLGVLVLNVGLSWWETAWARRLDSDLLLADARHTWADVLTTIVVIVGWQLAARGYPWLDSLFALGVAAMVLVLAYGLFARAIPILVDHVAIEPEDVERIARSVPGVREVKNIRSRRTGGAAAVDLIVTVDASLPTAGAHEIADRVEDAVQRKLHASDVTVHIEPEPGTYSA